MKIVVRPGRGYKALKNHTHAVSPCAAGLVSADLSLLSLEVDLVEFWIGFYLRSGPLAAPVDDGHKSKEAKAVLRISLLKLPGVFMSDAVAKAYSGPKSQIRSPI